VSVSLEKPNELASTINIVTGKILDLLLNFYFIDGHVSIGRSAQNTRTGVDSLSTLKQADQPGGTVDKDFETTSANPFVT
jgi:prepilin-type processing-associated H-X9-DG protein